MLDTAEPLTLQEAADHLGVHYMTAYRYIRTGILSAVQEGGRWLVEPAEVQRLASKHRAVPRAPRGTGRLTLRANLVDRLVAGDESGCWRTVQSALTSGASSSELYLQMLAPAMVEVGRRWEAGELDVADEHRASALMMRLLGRLGPLFSRPGRSRGTVVLGCPPGERHALATALLSDVLRGRGFAVVDLGADTPAPSFAHAARNTAQLKAVMVGVTYPGALGGAAEVVSALREAPVDVPVMIGGSGVRSEQVAREVGADYWTGADADTAADTLEAALREGSAAVR